MAGVPLGLIIGGVAGEERGRHLGLTAGVHHQPPNSRPRGETRKHINTWLQNKNENDFPFVFRTGRFGVKALGHQFNVTKKMQVWTWQQHNVFQVLLMGVEEY